MTLVFKEFEKIARLNREVIVTEKIDGTNAGVHITRATGHVDDYEAVTTAVEFETGGKPEVFLFRASSRNGYIVPGPSDQFGFAAWVKENARELVGLGEGLHFGEWWGQGIQRKYGLSEKRFSLFNVSRWVKEGFEDGTALDWFQDRKRAPACCHVVPVIYAGVGIDELVRTALEDLVQNGSRAAPGFMKPEGVVAYHTASRQLFKVTLERDEEPKSKVPRPDFGGGAKHPTAFVDRSNP